MRRFLITGLPRSGTAWLSVAATTKTTNCVHEPTRYCRSLEGVYSTWECGISDAGLGLHLGRIRSEIDPLVLIVERPLQECFDSFAEYMDGVVDPWALRETLNRLSGKLKKAEGPSIRRIQFAELRNTLAVVNALEWLIPGAGLERIPGLMKLNIQADRECFMDDLRANDPSWILEG